MSRPQRPFARTPCGVQGILLVLLWMTVPYPSQARTTIVPDDFPTLQAAADALYEPWAVDTLLVRGGTYPDRVVFQRGIHVEAIPSLDGSDRVPRIQGLQATSDGGDNFGFVGLRFTGHVHHGPTNGPARFQFVDCVFDAGMSPGAGSSWPEIESVRLTRCTLYQIVYIRAFDGIVESCTAHGPVILETPYTATVLDNQSENVPGIAFAISARDALIARNRVRGGDHAFNASDEDHRGAFRFEDNDIEGCRGHAIRAVGAENGTILERNRIARCGGFGAQVTGSVIARGNLVTDCVGPGLELSQVTGTGIVEGNVVGRCGVAGIQLADSYPEDPPPKFSVRENTIYGCTGPGIAISGLPGSTIANNLVYACLGLSANNTDPLFISANNWYPAYGVTPSPTDLSVDPHFCDIATDDVSLMSDSPLLDVLGHGRIGALGLGCEAPMVAMGFEVWPRVLQPSPRARWVTAWLEPPSLLSVTQIDVASVRVNDVPAASGAETTVGDHDRDGIPDLQVRFDREALERTLTAGDELTLTVIGRVDGRRFTGTDAIRVLRYRGGPRSDVPRSAPRDRVLSIRAQGSHGLPDAVRVAFTLVDEEPARLDILDVTGRVVAIRDLGAHGPGEHMLDLSTDGYLAQGIYFLRLRQGTSEARTRAVVVR